MHHLNAFIAVLLQVFSRRIWLCLETAGQRRSHSWAGVLLFPLFTHHHVPCRILGSYWYCTEKHTRILYILVPHQPKPHLPWYTWWIRTLILHCRKWRKFVPPYWRNRSSLAMSLSVHIHTWPVAPMTSACKYWHNIELHYYTYWKVINLHCKTTDITFQGVILKIFMLLMLLHYITLVCV